ncbi:PUA-like domain-containing protein [Irpex lacteus]|nr:PUA-like domain-containing protein [Irpex lacteus]
MPRAAKKESPAAVIGAIEGVPIGKWWPSRNEVVASHVHAYIVAGIHGRKKVGAFSVVLTADSRWPDEDHGETFTYIGSGGGEPGKRSGRQVEDQKMTNSRNASLEKSTQTRKPVRVIRGPAGIDSRFAPYYGFRYDGLYLVSNARTEDGPNGFKICKFDFTV